MFSFARILSLSILIAGSVSSAFAQYYYATKPILTEKITSVMLMDETRNEEALENQKLILPNNWKHGKLSLVQLDELNQAITKESVVVILPLVNRDIKAKTASYSLAVVSVSKEGEGIESKKQIGQEFLNRDDFEVLAEVMVDSALYLDGLYRRIYLKSILQYCHHYSTYFEKDGPKELYRWGFAVFTNDSIVMQAADIAEHLRKPEPLNELLPRMEMVQGKAVSNAFRQALRNKHAIADVFEVKRDDKRYALRCLYTLEMGLIYAEERELTEKEVPVFYKQDLSRLQATLKENEKQRLLGGSAIGR